MKPQITIFENSYDPQRLKASIGHVILRKMK